VFREHIVELQRKWERPSLYEHYVWLIDEIRERDTRRWWQVWRWS